MAEAEWDARFRRTGFYETHNAVGKNGFSYRKFVPVYLVNVIGTSFGIMIEPADAFPGRTNDGKETSGSSEVAYGKVDEMVELGTRLNEVLEEKIDKENRTPLHACSFGWPI